MRQQRGNGRRDRPLRTDVEWQLVSIQPTGQPAVTVADPTRYTVRFGADGSVSARVDCNRCAGRYQVDGPALTINPVLACTRAACALPSLESQFTEALTSVSSYIQRRASWSSSTPAVPSASAPPQQAPRAPAPAVRRRPVRPSVSISDGPVRL